MVQQGENCGSWAAELDLASSNWFKSLMNATLTPLARTVTSGYSAASVCGKRAVYDLKYLLLNPKKE